MRLAVKVWHSGEAEPEGLFNKRTCPSAPDRWFAEDPEYAAELYALELALESKEDISKKEYKIYVLDNENITTYYTVTLQRVLQASVEEKHSYRHK